MADFVLSAEVIVEAQNAITDVDRLGNTFNGIDKNLAVIADQLDKFMQGFEKLLPINNSLEHLDARLEQINDELVTMTFEQFIPQLENMTKAFEAMTKELGKMQTAIEGIEKGLRAMIMFMLIMNNMDLEEFAEKYKDMENEIGKALGAGTANFKDVEEGSDKSNDAMGRNVSRIAQLGLAFASLGAIAGSVFGYITQWSPSLQAVFGLISVEMGLAAMAIGEELAPIIEDTLLPAAQKFREWVEGLSPEMKRFVGLSIGLAVAFGMIAAVAGAVAIAIAVGAAPFILLAAAITLSIAAIVVWGEKIDYYVGKAVDFVRDKMDSFAESIKETRSTTDGAAGFLVALLGGLAAFVAGIIQTIIDIFLTIIEMAGTFIGALKKLFTGDFKGFLEGLAQVIIDFLNFFVRAVNNIILDPLSIFFDADLQFNEIPDIEELFGDNKPATQMDVESTMATGTQPGTIDEILGQQQGKDEYHSGGVFMGNRPGLAMLKPKEMVLTETQQRSLGLKGGMGSSQGNQTITNTYNITIQGGNYTSPGQRRIEAEKFAKQLETQSNARGFV